jgi:MFS family permease
MELLVKIMWFALFLVAFGVWTVAISILLVVAAAHPAFSRSFGFVEGTLLLTYLAIFVFVYLLSGFWSWPLVALFILVAHFGVALSWILREVLGSPAMKWQSRALWAGREWDANHPELNRWFKYLARALIVLYLSLAGVSFFTLTTSPALTIAALQYTLAFFFITGLVVLGPQINIVASKNLDRDTRTLFLASQLGGLIPNALFLALMFLAFGAHGKDSTLDLGTAVSAKLWAQVFIVELIYFILVILLPHIVGNRRAERWREDLTRRKKELLSELTDILGASTSAQYQARLNELQTKVAQSIANFEKDEKDPMIGWGKLIDSGNISAVPAEIQAASEQYLECKDDDPRFKHLAWLADLAEGKDHGIRRIIPDLASMQTEADKLKAADGLIKNYARLEHRLDEEHTAEVAGIPFNAFILWVSSAVVQGALTLAVKEIWTLIFVPAISK